MAKKSSPTDINQRAKSNVDIATGEHPKDMPKPSPHEVKAAASALGRLGGLKGGKARAAALTAQERSEIAKKAALKRWRNKR